MSEIDFASEARKVCRDVMIAWNWVECIDSHPADCKWCPIWESALRSIAQRVQEETAASMPKGNALEAFNDMVRADERRKWAERMEFERDVAKTHGYTHDYLTMLAWAKRLRENS